MLEENEMVDLNNQEHNVNKETENQSESQFDENVAETEEVAEPEIIAENEIASLKNEISEQKDKYLRLFAEFDNFKKRNAKERIELFKTAGQDVIRDLLPILDDFQRADKAYEQDKNAENYANGVKLIQEKFIRILQSKGLKAIDSIGKDFDVSQHEAIVEAPAPNDKLKGKIIDEIETGYTLNDTIIRYAKVVVGK